MKDWMQHLPAGVAAVLLGVVGWFTKREAVRVEGRLNSHAERLRELEADRVTRDDIDELRASLTASINLGVQRVETSINRVETDVRELVRHLLNQRGGGG